MGFPFQTAKKVGAFISLGILPIVVLLIGILFGVPLIEGAIASIFFALILVVVAFKFTDSPFLRMYEGSSFGVLTIDSRGKLDFFDVKLQSGRFVGEYDGKTITAPFMQSFFFRISDVFGKGKAVETGDKLTIELEKQDYSKSLFKTDFPILFWNRQLNSFVTKEWLQQGEKRDMIIALGYETRNQVQEYNKTASGITRMVVDMIGAKLKNQSHILWILVIIIVAVLLYFLWPQLSSALGGTINSATSAVGGASNSLPTKLG